MDYKFAMPDPKSLSYLVNNSEVLGVELTYQQIVDAIQVQIDLSIPDVTLAFKVVRHTDWNPICDQYIRVVPKDEYEATVEIFMSVINFIKECETIEDFINADFSSILYASGMISPTGLEMFSMFNPVFMSMFNVTWYINWKGIQEEARSRVGTDK